jgi:hypothetical protein
MVNGKPGNQLKLQEILPASTLKVINYRQRKWLWLEIQFSATILILNF